MTIESVASNMWWFIGIGSAAVAIISGGICGLFGFALGRITKQGK